MDDNKSKALAAALSQIEKQFGKGSIMKMDDAAIKDIDVVSTGSLGLDLGLGRERRHRVDDDHVDRARAHQHVGDLERLLAGVGLGNEQVLGLDAELGGVGDVERVFRVDEGGGAADFLHLGDDLEGQRGLARGFRAVDLDHPSARQSPDAEREVPGLPVVFSSFFSSLRPHAMLDLLSV